MALNALGLAIYMLLDGGGGGGFGFGGGGGGGRGGGGGGSSNFDPNRPQITSRDLDSVSVCLDLLPFMLGPAMQCMPVM